MKRLLTLFVCILFVVQSHGADRPKYIFYFIGDGMGFQSMALTEAWRADNGRTQYGNPLVPDSAGFQSLVFTTFPAVGFATTHCANSRITDSAASGTALATGSKTTSGTLGMDGERTLHSIMEDAQKRGLRTGVATSVSIDHATPAAFYAHQPKRSMYYEIAGQMATAGLDLYAGAGLLDPEPEGKPSVWQALNKAGYTVTRGDRPLTGKRAVLIQADGYPTGNLPLAIDARRDTAALTLPAITRRAIDYLGRDDKGFVLMVEGGQIDWCGHGNDAAAMVREVVDFEDAVLAALEFYNVHPRETLIVITADHETGGLSLGNSTLGYDSDFGLLAAQQVSKNTLEAHLKSALSWSDAQAVLQQDFTLTWTEKEWAALHTAYTVSASRAASAAVGLLDRRTGVAWGTGAHTAAYVPVMAIGVRAGDFAGRSDNALIANLLRSVIQGKTPAKPQSSTPPKP